MPVLAAVMRASWRTPRLQACKSLSRLAVGYYASLVDPTASRPGFQSVHPQRCFGCGARTRLMQEHRGDQRRRFSRDDARRSRDALGPPGGLVVSPEVAEAVAADAPVVALESTIYTHGALGGGLDLARVVRENGAVPAVVGIVGGVAKVGVSDAELARMVEGNSVKVSRRDVAMLVGMGMTGTKRHGGTTVAATMLLARQAGIRVFGTGGLGGVHRGYERYMDVSADLTELARTRVAVVSSGCKGFLDIKRTLEYLETAGVAVATFADGRSEDEVGFPAFWVRDSGIPSPSVVHNEAQAAAMILAQERLGIESGILFANPIPEEYAIPAAAIDQAIELAVREAEEKGFSGNRNTPFILAKIRELTDGRSVPANIALVEANVARAARIAVEVSRMLARDDGLAAARVFVRGAPEESRSSAVDPEQVSRPPKPHILVAGSVAIDLSCDYSCEVASDSLQSKMPTLQTSNPATISQSIGGVGRNVALAAQLATDSNEVKLCTMVGDDIAGDTIIAALESSGLDTSFVRKLGHEYACGRTAQYVAVNDADKNLMLAMADMAIFATHSFPGYWKSAVAATRPDWLVVDANWSEEAIRCWITAGKENGAKTVFEPVSTAKAARLFPPRRKGTDNALARPFPDCAIDLATPNQLELGAMFEAAAAHGYFDNPSWFGVLDTFGITGARDEFVRMTSVELTDAGIPIQSVQLLPYIPTIVTKLGADGALLTKLLLKDDPLLSDTAAKPYILSRSRQEGSAMGGIYMRLYPAVEVVKDPVSVNGVGDTFLGLLVAGLSQGGRIEELVDLAQKAAVMTLRSKESVSWELGSLQSELSRRCCR